MRKHWFFDFDGTLCETDADIRSAWGRAISEIDAPHRDFNEVYRNGPAIDDMTRELFGADCTDAIIERVRDSFKRNYDGSGYPNTVPYPQAMAWIDELKRAGCEVYIVTNKRYRATRLLVAKFGWESLFKGVYSSDMFKDTPLGKLKKPALLAEALRRENVRVDDAVMVGDTKGDIDAGKANGVWTVGVTWGYARDGELSEADEIRSR